jgi:hypothetical protein
MKDGVEWLTRCLDVEPKLTCQIGMYFGRRRCMFLRPKRYTVKQRATPRHPAEGAIRGRYYVDPGNVLVYWLPTAGAERVPCHIAPPPVTPPIYPQSKCRLEFDDVHGRVFSILCRCSSHSQHFQASGNIQQSIKLAEQSLVSSTISSSSGIRNWSSDSCISTTCCREGFGVCGTLSY